MRTRQGIALGGLALVLLLLVFGVRGCLDARKERAFKDYVRDVDALMTDSDQQGDGLFRLLGHGGGLNAAVRSENQLNQFRQLSAALVDRARDTDRPDELSDAHGYLLETLEFRRDGLAGIADAIPNALGDAERREGTNKVAAQMQAFLASDVVYHQRFVPTLQGALDDEDLGDEVQIPTSQFLPDIDWLQPSFVADRVRGLPTGNADKAATPGLHGNGIGSVTLGGQALTPGGSVSVKLARDLKFQVQVANQGENTETDVGVRITIGKGADAIELSEQLDTIARGETKTVDVALTDQPPTGQNVPIEVEVEPVAGEKKTDNNKQSYSAIFTR